jgi:hypothetical protein
MCQTSLAIVALTSILGVSISVTAAMADNQSRTPKDPFLINKENASPIGIDALMKRLEEPDSQGRRSCLKRWKVIWSEVEHQNPWAMFAMAQENRLVQNQSAIRHVSPFDMQASNRLNLAANIYYLNAGDKPFLKQFEDGFTNLRGAANSRARVAQWAMSERAPDSPLLVYASCVIRSQSSAAAEICFDSLAKSTGALRFEDFLKEVDDDAILKPTDVRC